MTTNLDYLKRLKAIECSDATYPCYDHPLVFDRGQGSLVFDSEGRDYIDLCGGFGVMALGHHHPALRQVLTSFASESAPVIHGMGDVYPSRAKVEFCERLLSYLPDHLSRIALSLTGSGAVESALKSCLLRKPAGKILCFEHGYHGVDLGILPLSSRSDFKAGFRSWLPQDHVITLPYNCSPAELTKALSGAELAAIFVEPVQGRGGVRPAAAGWLAELRSLASARNALLVFDEIFTGLGRVGVFSKSAEVAADIVCLGKSLGGGLPLSACCASEQAFSGWPESRGEAIHTGTFFGHPLSCAMGGAFLQELVSGGYIAANQHRGRRYRQLLDDKLANLPQVKAIRSEGMMFGIEFHDAGAGVWAMDQLREKGVIALVSGPRGEVLSLTPAYTITDSLFSEAVNRLAELYSA